MLERAVARRLREAPLRGAGAFGGDPRRGAEQSKRRDTASVGELEGGKGGAGAVVVIRRNRDSPALSPLDFLLGAEEGAIFGSAKIVTDDADLAFGVGPGERSRIR